MDFLGFYVFFLNIGIGSGRGLNWLIFKRFFDFKIELLKLKSLIEKV